MNDTQSQILALAKTLSADELAVAQKIILDLLKQKNAETRQSASGEAKPFAVGDWVRVKSSAAGNWYGKDKTLGLVFRVTKVGDKRVYGNNPENLSDPSTGEQKTPNNRMWCLFDDIVPVEAPSSETALKVGFAK